MAITIEVVAALMRIAAARVHAQVELLLRRRLSQAKLAVLGAMWNVRRSAARHEVACFERRAFEVSPGLTLVLMTFVPYEQPNWESWLFGKPIEDDQLAA
jgi:hypothetical protein